MPQTKNTQAQIISSRFSGEQDPSDWRAIEDALGLPFHTGEALDLLRLAGDDAIATVIVHNWIEERQPDGRSTCWAETDEYLLTVTCNSTKETITVDMDDNGKVRIGGDGAELMPLADYIQAKGGQKWPVWLAEQVMVHLPSSCSHDSPYELLDGSGGINRESTAEQLSGRLFWMNTRTIRDLPKSKDDVGRSINERSFLGGWAETLADADAKACLVNDFIKAGEYVNLVGPTKVGKSFLIEGCLLNWQAGDAYCGWQPSKPLSCLLIDTELTDEQLVRRVDSIAKQGNAKRRQLPRLAVKDRLGGSMTFEQFEKFLNNRCRGFDIIAIDCLYRLITDFDERSGTHVNRIQKIIGNFATENDCGVIVLHHTTKGDQSGKEITDLASGAGELSRGASGQVALREQRGFDRYSNHKLVVSCVFRDFEPTEDNSEFVIEKDGVVFNRIDETATLQTSIDRGNERKKAQKASNREKVLEAIRTLGDATVGGLINETGLSENGLRSHVKALESDGKITVDRTGKKSVYRAIGADVKSV